MTLDIKSLYTLIKIGPDIRHHYISVEKFHIWYGMLNNEDKVNVDQAVRFVEVKSLEEGVEHFGDLVHVRLLNDFE